MATTLRLLFDIRSYYHQVLELRHPLSDSLRVHESSRHSSALETGGL